MLHFEHRPLLLLIPAALPLLWLLRPIAPLSRLRRAFSFAARVVIVALLAGVLADPTLPARTPRPSRTIFAIDVSDSVGRLAIADGFAAMEASTLPPDGEWALIAFAGRAKVEVPPQKGPIRIPAELRARLERRDKVEAASELEPLETRPEPALLLAGSLHRGDRENRTILLTDGRCALAKPDPRTTLVALPTDRRRDLALRALHAPSAVRYGEPFNITVDLESTAAGEGTVGYDFDDAPATAASEKIAVPAGRFGVELRNLQGGKPLEPGFHRLVVHAAMAGDEEQRNNHAIASLLVVGRPRMLVIEGGTLDGELLTRMLQAQAIDHDRVALERLAGRLDNLSSYAAVALAGVAPGRLSAGELAVLKTYVENGGGLLFCGSECALRDPGLLRPEFASLLPVELTPAPAAGTGEPGPTPVPSGGPVEPKRVLAPTVALCLLIDKSGSMAGDSLKLAKEACIAAAKTLSEKDIVSVIAFDAVPHLALEFVTADRAQYIEEKILRIGADGGTDIQNGLSGAAKLFESTPRADAAGIKHCILLSDGKTRPGDLGAVVDDLRKQQIRVSTVTVGNSDDFDFPYMQGIARELGGRARFTASFSDVPQLFVDETRKVVLESEKKGDAPVPTGVPVPTPDPSPSPSPSPSPAGRKTVVPIAKEDHEILRGVDRGFPALEGLMEAKAKATSSTPLTTVEGAPVLAIWRFGLGKSAAWLSDLGGPWSRHWTPWPHAPRLFAQLLRHLSSATDDLDLASRVRLIDGRLEVEPPAAGDRLEVTEIQPKRAPVPLEAGPGGMLRTPLLSAPGGGSRVVAVTRTREGRAETLPILVTPPFPAEIAPPSDAPSRIDEVDHLRLGDLAKVIPTATMSADARASIAPWLFIAALLLLPLDVALRRIR